LQQKTYFLVLTIDVMFKAPNYHSLPPVKMAHDATWTAPTSGIGCPC
jgi:hypothetical protein